MGGPEYWWLNLTNITMGVGVALFALTVVGGIVVELIRGHRRSHTH